MWAVTPAMRPVITDTGMQPALQAEQAERSIGRKGLGVKSGSIWLKSGYKGVLYIRHPKWSARVATSA